VGGSLLGVKGRIVYGTSDDYGYLPAEDPVHINDCWAWTTKS
jgi:hypothetical protein